LRYRFTYQRDTSFKDDTASFGGGAFYNFPIEERPQEQALRENRLLSWKLKTRLSH
jgi:hypothetical protein